jgi:hypothetical protein
LPAGITAQATIGAPALNWQSRQWQIETRSGALPSSYRIAPHRQPPVMDMDFSQIVHVLFKMPLPAARVKMKIPAGLSAHGDFLNLL